MIRSTLVGLHELQNPWNLALLLMPGKRPVVLRLVNAPRGESFVIHPDERREFLRALGRTVLGRDTGHVAPPAQVPGAAVLAANGAEPTLPSWLPLLEPFLTGQYAWADCPATIRLRVDALVDELKRVLGDNLVGIYIHGSLATGCFNPQWSDVDLLGITKDPLNIGTKRSVAEAFLRHSRPPRGFEAMFVAEPRLRPWVFPTPFDFYFSEKIRNAIEEDLRSGAWNTWPEPAGMSNFLAAHVPPLRKRGIRLAGEPIETVFPAVPDGDYLRAILIDFKSKQERIPATTISGVLNACRVYSYLAEHRLDSKEEAALWALHVLPRNDRRLVQRVLDVYRGDRTLGERFDATEVARFFADMERRYEALQSRDT